jgi:pimeloyl-ACP methyl ester carboxylesterase
VIADRDIRLFILQNLRFRPGAPPTWRINLDAIRSGIGKLLDSVPCDQAARFEGPSYFIRGADSAHVSQGELECIGQRFPGYRLITIPNSGHWPHVQNPSQFLAELRSLLADIRGSREH